MANIEQQQHRSITSRGFNSTVLLNCYPAKRIETSSTLTFATRASTTASTLGSKNENSAAIETTRLPPEPGASGCPKQSTMAFSRDYQQGIKVATNRVTNQYRAASQNTK